MPTLTLTNWNHEISFDVPEDHFKTPQEVSEVQEIVRQAVADGQPVTVVGARHSTTECMVGESVVIAMGKMNQILNIDHEGMTVTAQAGVTLRQLCARLREENLQPPVVLEFGNYYLGAISGTHAHDTSNSPLATQFSSFVVGVLLVTPTGELMEVSETQNPEYLRAIRSHFGMFGVVCEVTVRVLPHKPLLLSITTADVHDYLDGGAGLHALPPADQRFGMLFPHTGKLLWQNRTFVDSATPGLESPLTPHIEKGNLFKDVLLPLTRAARGVSPEAQASMLSAAVFEWPTGIFHHLSYVIDPSSRGVAFTKTDAAYDFNEWAFSKSAWPSVLGDFLKLTERFERQYGLVLVLPTLVYFLPHNSASFLSLSQREDMIALDPTYPDPTNITWKAFRQAFDEMAMHHRGIPHINKARDGACRYFARAYDPDAIRAYLSQQKHFDPKGLFLNSFFRKMFAEYL